MLGNIWFYPFKLREARRFSFRNTKNKPKNFEKYVENAFKIDYASYKLAEETGKTEEIPEKFENMLLLEPHRKKISRWKLVLGAAMIFGAIRTGDYLYIMIVLVNHKIKLYLLIPRKRITV